jgi:hypothetical protein
MENLIYTWVQIVHNFGAVAVVDSPAAALCLSRENLLVRHKLAWLMVLGWLAQGASGIGFALTSYTMKGALPEVTGIALGALVLKVACTFIGTVLTGFYLATRLRWSATQEYRMWQMMFVMTITAITAAAFLRWYL